MNARATIGAVVSVIVAALLCSPGGALAQKPRAERPTYDLGEQWLRSDGVFELTRIEADRYVFTAANGREVQLGKDLAPIKTPPPGIQIRLGF